MAAVLLLLFLSVQFLAHSSATHQIIHHDANAADHHCVITIVADGLIDFNPANHSVGVTPFLISQFPPVSQVISSISVYGLPDGRGPPALS